MHLVIQMNSKVALQPAVVLHKRPYKETSFLVEFFTQDFGRIAVVAQGVRRPKSPLRETFLPFGILLITYSGKKDLKKLFDTEVYYRPKNVPNMSYACLIYINELIMSFLHKEDPHLNLFKSYVNFCKKIENQENQLEIEKMLRNFELSLLQEIGYGIDLKRDAETGDYLKPDTFYELDSVQGFIPSKNVSQDNNNYFKGEDIISFAKNEFDTKNARKVAKLITRHAIDYRLDGKEIKSRKTFS